MYLGEECFRGAKKWSLARGGCSINGECYHRSEEGPVLMVPGGRSVLGPPPGRGQVACERSLLVPLVPTPGGRSQRRRRRQGFRGKGCCTPASLAHSGSPPEWTLLTRGPDAGQPRDSRGPPPSQKPHMGLSHCPAQTQVTWMASRICRMKSTGFCNLLSSSSTSPPTPIACLPLGWGTASVNPGVLLELHLR